MEKLLLSPAGEFLGNWVLPAVVLTLFAYYPVSTTFVIATGSGLGCGYFTISYARMRDYAYMLLSGFSTILIAAITFALAGQL